MRERADRATRKLEKDFHVEWSGWSASQSWPIKRAMWFAVSSDGTVIVGQANVGNDVVASKWTEAEGGVLLGSLPGNSFSLANAVSPVGSIIVGTSSCTSDCTSVNSVAFIWDETNGMRNLQQVLENDFGLVLNDLDLTAAWGVTSNGSITVTGEAINPSGNTRGWVAVMALPIIDADED